MSWQPNTENNQPEADGRYLIIYRQGAIVRRFVEDYSTRDGWLLGLDDVEIIAWAPIYDIPQWVINKYSKRHTV